MATPLWPGRVLWPAGVSLNLAARSLAGPSSVSGKTQTVSSDAGIWKMTYSNIGLLNANQVLCFRGVASLLEGRLNPILVPLLRYETLMLQPLPDGQDDLYDPIPHSDGSTFGDGSEYQGGVIDVTLASAVPVRGVSANVTINNAATLQPGQHFSIGERLYRLKTVSYSSDTAAAITFRPPAREAANVGARLEFDFPVCRMRLASDSEMDLPLDHNVQANPSVNFIEDV